ncbi:MarR family transcriptional regulator [Streptomyces sp. SID3343]|uniref:MarR family winged helix-turn-helix transcriptional regulator n=1 Tax=Streptomyces sp. SID3343 TaxID=2690260 RepID=UPI0013719782|nr:MarR family transcriptional regulator [Streptomyces sp. SID3343]MYV98011.1 MarR family transcriptional regulator [Streptomyces sp. SID3343]
MERMVGHEVADALGRLLRRSTRANLYAGLTEGLGPAVDDTTYPVLSGLARTGPCSAAELAGEIGLDRSGVSRRASRLEAVGLVRREPDPGDRRAVLLTLTDAGATCVEAMRERLAARIEASLAGWPADEARIFARGLRRFVEDGPLGGEPATDAVPG